jgi:thiosulfate/3-mercaptopyruvate sulfurtransferase
MPEESMGASRMAPLVPASWLASHLHDDHVVALDCSWYLPSAGRDPDAEYRAAHIPRALRYDVDAASDSTNPLPHMLPSAEWFAELAGRLGVGRADRVVCYDGSGVNLSAARVWWMFRVFGHHTVAVLDGGFAAWSSETRPVQRSVSARASVDYGTVAVDRSLVWSRQQVEAALASGGTQIVDCRPAFRFQGKADEPRAGVRRGNIPGSSNLPYTEFSDLASGLLRGPQALAGLLRGAQLDVARPIVGLCGSGTSSCVLALAVEVLREWGKVEVGPPVAIYDGSWSEWGAGPT